MILNAVIHGNLAVGSGPAREWHDLAVREGQIAEALRDASRASRLVTVAAGLERAVSGDRHRRPGQRLPPAILGPGGTRNRGGGPVPGGG